LNGCLTRKRVRKAKNVSPRHFNSPAYSAKSCAVLVDLCAQNGGSSSESVSALAHNGSNLAISYAETDSRAMMVD
jgi:hypothetical protein